MYLHTIPRPPSIDDNVDGDKKSPARMTADGLGYNLAKKVCNRGKFDNSYTSLMDTIRRRVKNSDIIFLLLLWKRHNRSGIKIVT